MRKLHDLMRSRAFGVTRVGATATKAMLEQAKDRGIENELLEACVGNLKSNERSGGDY